MKRLSFVLGSIAVTLLVAMPAMASCEWCAGSHYNRHCESVTEADPDGWTSCNDYLGSCTAGGSTCEHGGGSGNCTQGGICEETQSFTLPEVLDEDFLVIEPASSCTFPDMTIEA